MGTHWIGARSAGVVAVVVAGCGGSGAEGEDAAARCDGVLQKAEGVVLDSLFDRDADGHPDAANLDCAATYADYFLDCDDLDAKVHPGALEVTCNGVDDDCNVETADAADDDSDGVLACTDCDDFNPQRFPGADEVCWDEIDNDCDGETDPGCGLDYNGVFSLNTRVRYQCAASLVDIDFDQVGFIWLPPYAAVYSVTGTQPGTLNGAILPDGSFDFELANTFTTVAACDEYYRFFGSFSDSNNFTAEFQAQFVGGACLNCAFQAFPGLEGSRY